MNYTGLSKILALMWLVTMLLAPAHSFAQTDRGTITGTVTDSTGAKVANATVSAMQNDTGAISNTTTTGTGNYTLPSLQVGTYNLTFEAPGFSKSAQTGIVVQTANVLRVDDTLQIGASTETVTVSTESPMLQAESASLSNTVETEKVENLPLNYAGSGLQNPTAIASLQPGANAQINTNGNYQVRVNGAPLNTYKALVDGQDVTSGIDPTHLAEGTPSQEALQEVTLQASNFAAEFGQVSGGLFNFTTKSGTNKLHGSGYEYFVNEIFNAGQPFTNNGSGGTIRPRDRANNFGGTVGGPIWIPRLYDGRNKTFFFINYEAFRTTTTISGQYATLPTNAFRLGDFSGALTGKQLGTDPLGRPIMENEIYDPLTTRTVNGQVVRDPFPGNIILPSRMDPVAAGIQALIPGPTNTAQTNNFLQFDQLATNSAVPSIKVDQDFGSKTKMSFYYGLFENDVPKNYGDGLPFPISSARTYKTRTYTYRYSLDEVFTPTLLLHFGLGEMRYVHSDSAPSSVLNYDAVKNLGLIGAARSPAPFPGLAGLVSLSGAGVAYSTTPNGAATSNLGFHNSGQYFNDNPTGVSSLTWVHGNHTYKTGVEWRESIWTDLELAGTGGNYNFAAQETGLPYLQSASLGGGNVGFPYASFLLGQVDTATITGGQEPNLRKYGYGIYIQDTWKATSKLTFDYGLRYDYQQAFRESRDRFSEFAAGVHNPSAGGLLGATQYQGYGPGKCNCSFTQTYPYAIGPRLGVAYALNDKTVIRGGWGVVYGSTPGVQYISGTAIVGTGWNTLNFTPSSYGVAPVVLATGLSYDPAQLTNASRDPGISSSPGKIGFPSYYIDPQAGRPARTFQYNLAIQRQINSKLSLEVAYVGNRGAWLQSALLDPNGNTAQRLASFGLDVTNANDRALLTSPLNSAQVTARGFSAPYAGFPTNLTLAQALRPYPQFGAIPGRWSPRGKTWYDGIQIKLDQRLWHGLDVTAGYSYQKELNLGSVALGGGSYAPQLINDVYNRAANKSISSYSQPQTFNTAITYIVPSFENRWVRAAASGWTVGTFLRYSSGYPIPAPYAQNNINNIMLRNITIGTGAFAQRNKGVNPFLKDLNCHCFNPRQSLTLNPAAWTDPAPGTFGNGSLYYNDYRYQRRPSEALSVGRQFPLAKEGVSFELRMELFNPFNRTQQADPDGTNALASSKAGTNGLQSGFGRINPSTLYGQPRSGQVTGRIRF